MFLGKKYCQFICNSGLPEATNLHQELVLSLSFGPAVSLKIAIVKKLWKPNHFSTAPQTLLQYPVDGGTVDESPLPSVIQQDLDLVPASLNSVPPFCPAKALTQVINPWSFLARLKGPT